MTSTGSTRKSQGVDPMLNYRGCLDYFEKLLLTMTLNSIGLPIQRARCLTTDVRWPLWIRW